MIDHIRPEDRVPGASRFLADAVLAGLNRWFAALDSGTGQRLITPGMVRGAKLSVEQFSVDATLIAASASMKSFRPKDGSGCLPVPHVCTQRIRVEYGLNTPKMSAVFAKSPG